MKLPEKNWLEWTLFAIGFVLVAGTLAYLLADALTASDAPPNIALTLGTPEPRGDHFVIQIAATNHGDQTAENVMVEVEHDLGDGKPEEGQFTIAFLPRDATRTGWVTFSSDPGAGELKARVAGYDKP